MSGRRDVANPWLACGGDRPAAPPCVARIEAQVARGGLAPAEGIRRLLAAYGAVQRRALAHLVADCGCGATIWGALGRRRRPRRRMTNPETTKEAKAMATEQQEKSVLDKQRVETEWWVAFSIAERELWPLPSEGYTLEWKAPEKKGDPGVYERFDLKEEEYFELKEDEYTTEEGVRRVRYIYDPSKPKPVEPPEDGSIGDVFGRAVGYMNDVLFDVGMVGYEEVWETRSELRSEFSGLADGEVLFSSSDGEVLTVGAAKLHDKAKAEAEAGAEDEAFLDATCDPEFHRLLGAAKAEPPGASGRAGPWLHPARALWNYVRSQRAAPRQGGRSKEKGNVLDRGRLALSSALTHLYGFPQPRADDVVALAEMTSLLCFYEKKWPEDWPKAWESNLDEKRLAKKTLGHLARAPHVTTTLDLLAHAPGVLQVLPLCRKGQAHVGGIVNRAAVRATDFLGREPDGEDAGTAWEEVLGSFERDAESELKGMTPRTQSAYPKPKGGGTIDDSRGRGRELLAPYPLPAPPFDGFNDSDDG